MRHSSTLDDYDTQACARFCNQADQCTAFNIYIERGPSTEVGPSCPDPASTAYYRCSIWGEPISNATATNTGYFVEDFEAAIAASNGSCSPSDTPVHPASPANTIRTQATTVSPPLTASPTTLALSPSAAPFKPP